MKSPITAETHKEFKIYIKEDVTKLLRFILLLKSKAELGHNTPYNAATFIRHAEVNHSALYSRYSSTAKNSSNPDEVPVPARLLFWVYRGSKAMDIRCPIELPHICKLPSTNGEKFFVATREDWLAHREATLPVSDDVQVSDHAKLQYINRVLGLDIDKLLESFPKINGKYRVLVDGRREYEIGNHIYLIEDNVCVSVLTKQMVTI